MGAPHVPARGIAPRTIVAPSLSEAASSLHHAAAPMPDVGHLLPRITSPARGWRGVPNDKTAASAVGCRARFARRRDARPVRASTWVLENPLPTSNTLNVVDCPSASTCYAVSDLGT